jgi:hypothetical protein
VSQFMFEKIHRKTNITESGSTNHESNRFIDQYEKYLLLYRLIILCGISRENQSPFWA